MKLSHVKVSKYGNGYMAQLTRNRGVWGQGQSVNSAIGDMVNSHPEEFGVCITVHKRTYDTRYFIVPPTDQEPEDTLHQVCSTTKQRISFDDIYMNDEYEEEDTFGSMFEALEWARKQGLKRIFVLGHGVRTTKLG